MLDRQTALEIAKRNLKFELTQYIKNKKWWQRPNHTQRAKSLILYLDTIENNNLLWDELERSEKPFEGDLAPTQKGTPKHFQKAKDTRKDQYNEIIKSYKELTDPFSFKSKLKEVKEIQPNILPSSPKLSKKSAIKISLPQKKTKPIEIELKTISSNINPKDEKYTEDRKRTPPCFSNLFPRNREKNPYFSNFLHQIRFSCFAFNKKHFSAPKESKEAIHLKGKKIK